MDKLDALVASGRDAGVTCATLLREGNAASCIVELAEALDADLVVMGAHGGVGAAAWFLGAVAEKVLRTSPCPVMTVSSSAVDEVGRRAGRVVCALDFSPSSVDTLDHAAAIAARRGAELVLVHVVDDEVLSSPPLPLGFDVEALRAWMEQDARERLVSAVAEADAAVPARVVVRWGKPYREVLRVAEEEEAALLVAGVHGTSPLQYGIFGSTANQLVRLARCPVLTVRPRLPRRRHEPIVDEAELMAGAR
jgi:nucleotide-binding universal stress UspA family protein